MSRLLQLTGAVVDLVYRIEALPAPGGEAVAERFAIAVGGGFNAAAAAQRAGCPTSYGGGIGTGVFADMVRAALAAEGIPALLPAHPSVDQGNCVVLVDQTGERSFISTRDGAEGQLDLAQLGQLPFRDHEFCLLSGYTLTHGATRESIVAIVTELPENIVFVFDPCPTVSLIPRDVITRILARCDWISANLAEAVAITNRHDPEAAALALRDHCPRAAGALLRHGAAGCWLALRDHGQAIHIPGFAVTPRDTTGAGDAHVGAFIAALGHGMVPADAARFANAAAALCVTRDGPATAPTRVEIEAFLASDPPTRQSGVATGRSKP